MTVTYPFLYCKKDNHFEGYFPDFDKFSSTNVENENYDKLIDAANAALKIALNYVILRRGLIPRESKVTDFKNDDFAAIPISIEIESLYKYDDSYVVSVRLPKPLYHYARNKQLDYSGILENAILNDLITRSPLGETVLNESSDSDEKVSNKTLFSQFQRIAFIHDKIRRKKYPKLEILAKLTKTSVATIRRDIDYMRKNLSAPIEFDREKNGYCYRENYSLADMKFSHQDTELLLNASIFSLYFKWTDFYDTVELIIDMLLLYKIKKPGLQEYYQHIDPFDSFTEVSSHKGMNMDENVFPIIRDALIEHREIEFECKDKKTGKVKKVVGKPCYLTLKNGKYRLTVYTEDEISSDDDTEIEFEGVQDGKVSFVIELQRMKNIRYTGRIFSWPYPSEPPSLGIFGNGFPKGLSYY